MFIALFVFLLINWICRLTYGYQVIFQQDKTVPGSVIPPLGQLQTYTAWLFSKQCATFLDQLDLQFDINYSFKSFQQDKTVPVSVIPPLGQLQTYTAWLFPKKCGLLLLLINCICRLTKSYQVSATQDVSRRFHPSAFYIKHTQLGVLLSRVVFLFCFCFFVN